MRNQFEQCAGGQVGEATPELQHQLATAHVAGIPAFVRHGVSLVVRPGAAREGGEQHDGCHMQAPRRPGQTELRRDGQFLVPEADGGSLARPGESGASSATCHADSPSSRPTASAVAASWHTTRTLRTSHEQRRDTPSFGGSQKRPVPAFDRQAEQGIQLLCCGECLQGHEVEPNALVEESGHRPRQIAQ